MVPRKNEIVFPNGDDEPFHGLEENTLQTVGHVFCDLSANLTVNEQKGVFCNGG